MSPQRVLLFLALALPACKSESGVDPIESTLPDDGALNAACSSDGDCDDGLSCNAGRRICVECIVDSDCTETQSCEGGACMDIPRCMDDDDCAEGVCDRERELCVACIVDEDCDAPETCVANDCEMQCEDDGACPDGRCDTAQSLCVECLEDGDCRNNQHCSGSARCEADVCKPGESQCSGDALLVCNSSGSGLDEEACSDDCVEDDSGAHCDGTAPPSVEPEDLTIPVTPGSPEPDAEPSVTPSPMPGPAEEPSVEPAMSPETTTEPVCAPTPEADPAPNPDPMEPAPQPTSGTPALMVVAERGSSMLAPYIPDAGGGCYYGGSPPYGDYSSRWEAVRSTVASFEDLASDIDFWALTYTGEIDGTCPLLSDTASAANGFADVVASLPTTEEACLEFKGESPIAAAIESAADALIDAAPSAPKYLLLFTRGTPDTCLVPDPQCGGDKAVGAVQAAYARGVTTLVVSLHDEIDVVVSEHLAQAGQGQQVAPFPEEVTGGLSCLEREYSLGVGAGFNYDDWRPYAAGTYAPTGFVYAETLSYTGLQVSELRATLEQIAMGTF